MERGGNKKYYWWGFVLICLLAMAFSRVVFLTVFMGDHFKGQAEGNMIRVEKVAAIRGVITDRNGKPLAMNIDNGGKLVRFYPAGEVTAGVVGYVGVAEEAGVAEGVEGKSGLEKMYQDRLAGVVGETVVEETAQGTRISEVERSRAESGENVMTNLDLEVQKTAFSALNTTLKSGVGKSGAVVVATVDGRVLALVSAPSFDANLFVQDGKRSDFGGDFADVESLLKDEKKKPLFNRAVSGDFAPGSVYKLVPALAALEEEKIDKDTLIDDSGEIVIGSYRFGNWLLDKYGQTEGKINVVKALARSNDIFFYKVGEYLGVDELVSWSKKVGFGKQTGIDLPGESAGFLPTPYWREKTLGEKWFLGNTYHLAIGQGDLMTTPLQINRMTAGVVAGKMCQPRLVGKADCVEMKIKKENKQTILEGMKAACDKGGTAFPLYDYGGKIYCKTGTAQKGGEKTEPNAWLSMVVPVGEKIEDWVVVTVLVEEGGEGSAVAAPIAKELVGMFLGE